MGRDPTTAMLPSAVGSRWASVNPTSANRSSTQRAARSHSSGGACRGSATERMATISASSLRARGIISWMVARKSMGLLPGHVGGLELVSEVLELRQLVGAVGLHDQDLALEHLAVHHERPRPRPPGA